MPLTPALPLPEPDDIRLVPPGFAPDTLTFSATSDIAALKTAWRTFEAHAAGHVFQSWAWVSNWHSTVGAARNIDPFVITATSRDGTMRLLLPLGIQNWMGGRWLVWLGAEHADYKGPLIDRAWLDAAEPADIRRVFKAALGLAPGVDAAALEDMPAETGGRPHPLRAFPHQLAPVASHSVRLGDDFDAFYRDKRSAASRKKLRQKQRRLEAEAGGPARLTIAASPQARARAITALIGQKRTRLAERGVPNMFASGAVRAFYRQLAERHPELCQLSTLQAGGEPCAANWGLVWRGRYYYVLSTMTDGPMRAHSPGLLHLNELMAWSIGQGLEVFDFTAGDEAYKDDWCDRTLPLFDVYRAFTVKGRGLARARAAARALKRELKANPLAWDAAQSLRKALHDVRARASGQTAW